jgi:type I restriction-modification system DNA methylase subunit
VNNFSGKVNFIWSVADLLRGPYRPNQYKDVMLPITVLRRLDCVLEPTKDKVLAKQKTLSGGKVKKIDPLLCRVTGVPFYNTSRYSFEKLKGDPNNIAANLTNYIKGFSTRAREIIEHFGFEEHIGKLDKADRLYLLGSRFCNINLRPHNIAQKTEVMVEHFRHFTMHKIGGKAKAMMVTSSRLHLVKYKQALDKHIKENDLPERFGTDFRPGDQLFFESIREDAVSDSNLRQAALANTMENFGYVFRKALEGLFIDRMDQNEEITAKFMNEDQFRDAVSRHLLKEVYEKIREEAEV